MNWIMKLFTPAEKADWRLVKEIQSGYMHHQFRPNKPDEKINEREEELTYYLYEDQNGNRKFEVVDSMLGDINIRSPEAKKTWVFRSGDYRHTIRPWLDGRYEPEIPDYETVPKNDFQNRLAKKKIKK